MNPLIELADRLQETVSRITCMADILAAVNPDELQPSRDGIDGLCLFLKDTIGELNAVSDDLAHL
jgi:hypothetical protein